MNSISRRRLLEGAAVSTAGLVVNFKQPEQIFDRFPDRSMFIAPSKS